MLSLGQFLGLGPVKSRQTGVAATAGTYSITTINPDKTKVNSWSKGSAGYVAVRGDIDLSPTGGSSVSVYPGSGGGNGAAGTWPSYTGSITGGTTDLIAKVFSAWLVDEDTIQTDGPCRWEVIEFRGVI